MLRFGPRMNQVFASRWKALMWSLGILATAYCSIPDQEQSAQPDQTAQLEKLIQPAQSEPTQSEPPAKPKNPWAK